MQESSLAILVEAQSRLSLLISEGGTYSPPERLRLRDPKAVLLGKASGEQQAIAVLHNQICTEHELKHKAEGLPEGINPRVSFDHYRDHVMAPLLSELLVWSAHRDYPDVSETFSIVAIQFDSDWNMYAVPRAL